MRKFFTLVAIVGLALLVASPAMALDFKFGAEYRVRFYDALNTNFTKDPGTNPRGVQIRVRPRFDVSDDNGNMTATLRLEIGDIEWGNGGGAAGTTNGVTLGYGSSRSGNGSGGQLGVDGVNVETKWAYVDFAAGGLPLRVRAGLQPWYESKGIFVDDDVAGVRAYGKTGMLSYEVGWYRAEGGPLTNSQVSCAALPCNLSNPQGNNAIQTNSSNTRDDNYDFYEAKVGLAVAPWLNPTVYYIYGDNRSTNTTALAALDTAGTTTNQQKPVSAHFFGARLDGNFNIFSYDLDFVYGSASGSSTGNYTGGVGNLSRIKTNGWGLDGGLHFPVGPALIHVVGSYATGDKQNGGNSEALPYISPSWNGAGGLYELVGSGGTFDQTEYSQDYPAGLWMLGFGAEYRPVKALWLRAMYGYIGFTGKRANCAYSNSKVSGACFGPSYAGKNYTAPVVDAAQGNVVGTGGVGGVAGKSTLGQEISLRADYDLWTNFKIQGAAGWLVPSNGDTVHEYVLQLLYSF